MTNERHPERGVFAGREATMLAFLGILERHRRKTFGSNLPLPGRTSVG